LTTDQSTLCNVGSVTDTHVPENQQLISLNFDHQQPFSNVANEDRLRQDIVDLKAKHKLEK
jgi:hypothetical protein